jgi:microcystin-dependent protein
MAQSDQVIQNNTGSNVRADINNNLAALYSLSSGSSEPSTTTAHQLWLDTSTTPDTLKIRNASDNGWISLGTAESNLGLAALAGATFTGNVLIAAGTVGAGSLSFAGDTDTGLYRVAANDLGITAGGTLRAHFNSDGLTLRDGKALRFRDSGNSNIISLAAPALTSDVALTLPNSDGNSGDMLQTNGSGVLSWQAVQGVPSGSVFTHASTTLPSGYLECNGAAVSRSTYAALFSAISTTWGSGDGSSTFNVPDLRGEFVRGFDNSRGVDSGRSFASSQGSQYQQHNHSASATSSVSDPGHRHKGQSQTASGSVADGLSVWVNDRAIGNYGSGSGSGGGPLGTRDFLTSETTGVSVSTSVTVNNAGGTGNSSETRPRNISMIYIIKT